MPAARGRCRAVTGVASRVAGRREDQEREEPLQMEVLDNLRKLFARLPDGRYRIYQIEPDGIERAGGRRDRAQGRAMTRPTSGRRRL